MGCGGCGGNKVVRGAVGVGKAVLGIDRAAPEVRAQRLAICRGCDHFKPHNSRFADSLSRCAECDCVIHLKVKVAGETCPVGKW